jgi:lysyl-tRNA synthetase class 2
MKAMGIIPYAQSFHGKQYISDIITQYEDKELRSIDDIILAPQQQVKTAGRVMLYRTHGKLAFARLLDSTEQIQLMFHSSHCEMAVQNSECRMQNDGTLFTDVLRDDK